MSEITTTSSELKQLTQVAEEQQITLHCSYNRTSLCRIWKTTFLVCSQTGKKAQISHALNIPWYPRWKQFSPNEPFTLIFEPLPKGCTSFDLLEDIPQYGGFMKTNILRNKSDVYRLNLS